jgi:transposase
LNVNIELSVQLGIANSLCHKQSNVFAERMNVSIQELKCIAKGFRNTDNFSTAILFQYGKLDLLPH